ncbi:MAG: hypothetical protein KKF21_01530 [Bacteroidetes bacterium]|nr:hypothetical protein [Bacteroidota bacterium]MBU1797044.1 hypothetical protein [Bacteroidota bacterium]
MQIGVSYYGNRILKHVKSDMHELKQNGFTFVLHTYSEFDLMFNSGTMKEIFKITHDEGLDVWVNPWGVGNVFGGEPFSNFASKNIFNSCQVLDDGKPTPIACPNSPEFNKFMDSWIEMIIDSNVDEILWDEPHFHEQGFLASVPGRWGCRCEYCKSKFEEEFNYPLPAIETDDVKLFKKNSLFHFITRLSEKASKGGVKNTLYLTANIKVEQIEKEWEKFFDISSIKTVATGPYWIWEKATVKKVADFSKALHELTLKKNKQSQIWIQGFKITDGREHEVSKAISSAINAGIENIAIWGYEGSSQESWLVCDNPEVVWKNILDTIHTTKI